MISVSSSAPDPRIRRRLPPQRIVWQNGNVIGAELLIQEHSGQAMTGVGTGCVLKNEGKIASIVLDFGRELHGSVQCVVGSLHANKPLKVRLRFGESVSEVMGTPNNDHALHDWEIPLVPMSSQEIGQTGFRFARLDLLDEGTLNLNAMQAITLEREPEEIGSFECSDARLNEIWRVGRETVRLCLQDFVWDGIKRDRIVWLGDLHPEVKVILAAYGDLDIVPQSLDFARDHTPIDANDLANAPWMNGIGSYSMWWVILQRDWFWHSGDRKYLEEQREYLTKVLPALMLQIEGKGHVNWRGRVFMDWPTHDRPDATRAGLHALLVWCLNSGAQLCDELGERDLARTCREQAELLQRGAPSLPIESKAASALHALQNLHDAQDVNAQVLAAKPLRDLSTFYGYYVLQARAMAGDYQGALDDIRGYWGGMLDLGATSFWEHFELAWSENATRIDELPQPDKHDIHREYGDHCYVGLRHSLCHGWAAGPTAWLSEHVLGVQVLAAGCKKVKIAPHLGDLDWARGTFPTPHGPIRVSHRKQNDGEITSEIDAPAGVEVVTS